MNTRIAYAPALMSEIEKNLLYWLIRGIQPKHYLEIGSYKGGSADIVCHAMDANGFGDIVMVDPQTDAQLDPAVKDRIRLRASMVVGKSPNDVPKGEYDFILIDGSHDKYSVLDDLIVAFGNSVSGGLILCHDPHFSEVREGIKGFLSAGFDESVLNIGDIVREPTYDDRRLVWGGFYLLRRI